MRILQISHKSPWPPLEGGPIAMHALITGLQAKGHEVHVLTMSTPKFPLQNTAIPKDYAAKTAFEYVHIDTSVHAIDALKNLFSRRSYNIERFISDEFESVLIQRLQKNSYEVIILESLYVTPYIDTIRKNSAAKIIFRAHNVEHRIWERMTKATHNPLKRAYLGLLTRRLLHYEQRIIPTVDGIAAITGNDAKFFAQYAGKVKVTVVPFGINPEEYVYTPQEARQISLCHIGSMDWLPNTEGIKWFLDKCWPGLHKVFPSLKLHLAGRNMPAWLLNNTYPNVVIAGEVEDARTFMTNHPAMIVPLLAGSGVRVKIIEAMALGRTVITTPTGAEGICYTQGENILIAKSPVAFFELIKSCIDDPSECARIGQNARALIESGHHTGVATTAMLELISEAVQQGK
jgi:polysaccharide biosynthesis protein PslH